MLAPEAVGAYLEAAIKPLSLTGLLDRTRLARQFKFALQFSIFAVMTSFDDPRVVETVRRFFRSKYQVAIDLLIGASSRGILAPAKAALREFLYSRFDKFGAEQWDKFIGGMPLSGNNDFYVERDGVVQQKVMEEFLPYVCDLHNGDLDRLRSNRMRRSASSCCACSTSSRPASSATTRPCACRPSFAPRIGASPNRWSRN